MNRATHLAAVAVLVASAQAAQGATDFTDEYAVANWTQSLTTGPTFDPVTSEIIIGADPGTNDGGIDLNNAPFSVTLLGGNAAGADVNFASFTDFTIAASGHQAVSFSFAYDSGFDYPLYDHFGYLLNGTFHQLSDPNGAQQQTGTASFVVAPDDIFGFRVLSDDSFFDRATVTVSNFAAVTAVPVPAAVWLLGSAVAGLWIVPRRGHLPA